MPLTASRAAGRVILGLLTFGPKVEDGARITDLDTFNEALDIFQARGYHEADTARLYGAGTQEGFTREAGWKQRGITLATKVIYPSNHGENSAKDVVESVEQLARLRNRMRRRDPDSNYMQVLYLHCPDRGTPFQETLEAMNLLYRAGKFVRFGLSNFTAFEVAEVVMTCKYNGWVRPTVYQAMYNVITRNIEPELLIACRRYGLDVVVYNPLAGGLLSGRITSRDMVPPSGRFSDVCPAIGSYYRKRYFRESTFRAMQVIEAAVAKHDGLTIIETALRWLVHHSKLHIKDRNDGIILGVSSVEQLENNLDNLEKGPLPADVVEALDQAWVVSRADSANYWHGEVVYGYDTLAALYSPRAK